MNKSRLSAEILSSVWAIMPDAAFGYLPQVAAILTGQNFDLGIETSDQRKKNKPFCVLATGENFNAEGKSIRMKDASQGSVAVIPITGIMMKDDQACGPVGSDTIGNYIKSVDENPNLIGCVLKMNTPGGSVFGTSNLSDIIANAKKPVVVLVDEMMCSAGYWAGSGADYIMMGTKIAQIGCIGTMFSCIDMTAALEKAGVKMHEIYATDSVDKNGVFKAALAGDYGPIKKELLDPMNKQFTTSVKKNRGSKMNLDNENVLTGKVYMAKAAITAGLADGLGTIDDAIAMVRSLANGNENNTTKINQTQNPMKFKATMLAIAAFFGWDGAKAAATDVTVEHLEKMDAELATLATIKSERDIKATELVTALENAKTKDTEITSLKNEILDLKKKIPGETATNLTKIGEEGGEAKNKILVESAAHNKAADEMLGNPNVKKKDEPVK